LSFIRNLMPTTPITSQQNNLISNTAPIGIFDSGVGGLSIFNCVAELLPNEQLIYVADTMHAPYGDKSDDEIIERVNTVADALITRGCKMIVVACNTATVTAITQLRERVTIPIIGVEPAIKPAALTSHNKSIAILATQATSTNQRFLTLVDKHKQDADVHIQPCPGLVELIENHKINSTKFDDLLKTYLANVLSKNSDTIVLGCTHYPFFADKIKTIVGENVVLMETAKPVTAQLKRRLEQLSLTNNVSLNSTLPAKHQFYSTAPTKQLKHLMSYFIQTDIELQKLSV